MKKDIKFQGIGKNTPYKAPDAFFEEISAKTLLKARQREHDHRKSLVLWRTVGVAASLAAVVLLSYFILEPAKPENKMIVNENQHPTEQVIEPEPERSKPPVVAIVEDDTSRIASPEVNSPEEMTAVLADLSDEELMLLAAMFKADPFIEEAIQ